MAIMNSRILAHVAAGYGIVGRFLLTPRSADALGVLRIGVAGVLLVEASFLAPHLVEIFGSLGTVQWPIAEAVASPSLPSVGRVAERLLPFGILPDGALHLIFWTYLLSLCTLLAGRYTRFSALIAWSTHAALMNTASLTTYGVGAFAHIALFYCIIMPVGDAFSLDYHWRRHDRSRESAMAGLSLRVLQLHLCIVYLASGIEKARGEQWWNGEAIWRAVMQPQFQQFDMSWLASVPFLALSASLGTLVVECGYCIMIWPRSTRPYWVGATLGLHAGIGIFLGLWTFSAMMMMLTFAAFGLDLVRPLVVRPYRLFELANSNASPAHRITPPALAKLDTD